MRIWTSLCIASILIGCATSPRVELPKWDISITQAEETAAPTLLPELCELQRVGDILGWDARCTKIFLTYEVIAEGNTAIAEANTSALRKNEAATGHLVNAAKMQQTITVILQDLLEEERAAHAMDNWTHKLIIALGLLGAAL